VSAALTLVAYLTVLAIAVALIALISWSILRVDRGQSRSAGRARRRTRHRRAPA